MASPAYELILEIQGLDQSIAQLRHRAVTHPERQKLVEIDRELADHDAEVAVAEERRHGTERDLKRLEDEVATIAARRQEIDGKLYGGEVTASKELLALQDEATSLLGRQTAMEDDELVIMEQLEELSGDLDTKAAHRATVDARRQAGEADLATSVAEIEAEVAELTARRAEQASGAAGVVAGWSELLGTYESLRTQYDGVPVARLVQSRCDGCHIQLSAVAVDQIAKMPDDAVVTCEECGRLLVR